MKIHPFANIFPMMDDASYQLLKADIEANGIQEYPVCDSEGQLLDGRNRMKACEELGIDVTPSEIDGSIDPLAYVMSANLHRRHLETSQRAMVAAKLANIQNGHNRYAEKVGTQNCVPTSIDDAAELLRVSPRTVNTCKFVIDGGSAELIAAVEQGAMSSSLAHQLIKAVPTKKEQTRLLARGADAIKKAISDAAPKPKITRQSGTAAPDSGRPQPEPTRGASANTEDLAAGESGGGAGAPTPPVAGPEPPCPECGQTNWDEDDKGRFCASCCVGEDDPPEDLTPKPSDPVKEWYATFQGFTAAQQVRARAMILADDLEATPKKRGNFQPPKLSEVRAYCAERGKGIDAEQWYDHYTANGWKVGKNPMKDWRASVRTWEKTRDGEKAKAGDPRGNQAVLEEYINGV